MAGLGALSSTRHLIPIFSFAALSAIPRRPGEPSCGEICAIPRSLGNPASPRDSSSAQGFMPGAGD
jgi:hypothetical protein